MFHKLQTVSGKKTRIVQILMCRFAMEQVSQRCGEVHILGDMQNLPGHGPGNLLKVIVPEQGDWTRQSSEVLSNLNKIVILLWCAWHFRVPRLTPLFRVRSSSVFASGFVNPSQHM